MVGWASVLWGKRAFSAASGWVSGEVSRLVGARAAARAGENLHDGDLPQRSVAGGVAEHFLGGEGVHEHALAWTQSR